MADLDPQPLPPTEWNRLFDLGVAGDDDALMAVLHDMARRGDLCHLDQEDDT